jgi:hypothetical protein
MSAPPPELLAALERLGGERLIFADYPDPRTRAGSPG